MTEQNQKRHVILGTIGHIDHGKSTMTAAIAGVLAQGLAANEKPLVKLSEILSPFVPNTGVYAVLAEKHPTYPHLRVGETVRTSTVLTYGQTGGKTSFETENTRYELV